MLKVIKHDLFNISNRLKKADKNLILVFNKTKNRYEVYIKQGSKLIFAFCLGKKINAYAVKKAYLTSCKFAKKIINEINETNKKLKQKEEQDFLDRHLETFNKYLEYANSKNADVTF